MERFVPRKKIIRVSKYDSAFVYFTLEASEGLTMYSTLEHQPGSRVRDLELLYTVDFEKDLGELLDELGEVVPIRVLTQSESSTSSLETQSAIDSP